MDDPDLPVVTESRSEPSVGPGVEVIAKNGKYFCGTCDSTVQLGWLGCQTCYTSLRWEGVADVPTTVKPFLDDPFDRVVGSCVLLGGSGYHLPIGERAVLRFSTDGLLVRMGQSRAEIAVAEIVHIDIAGPGEVTSGGGFGFLFSDIDSLIKGLAWSTALNWLTTKTEVHTIIHITTESGELFFHHSEAEPASLRISLSPAFTALRMLHA